MKQKPESVNYVFGIRNYITATKWHGLKKYKNISEIFDTIVHLVIEPFSEFD